MVKMPRKKPVPGSDLEVLDGLRCMWELVAVFQFIGLFRSKFHFCWLAIEDLESSLLEDNSVVFADIVARLLRYALQRTDIKIFNWEQHLPTFLTHLHIGRESSPNHTPYGKLSPQDKLLLLKALTDGVYNSNDEDLAEHLNDYHSPDDMRYFPIGQDSSSNLYWYFNDLRLYKEYRNPRKNRPRWECIASTYEEWHSFLRLLVKNTQPNESELYASLHNEVMPFIQSPLESRREDRRLFKKRLRAASKIGTEEDVLQELKVPKYKLEELLEQEERDITKMSEELAKLAKMANSADLKVNSRTHMSSPSLPSLLCKDELPMLKEEGLKMDGFKTGLMNSGEIDIKREHFDDSIKKDHKVGNMFLSENSGKLTDDIKGHLGADERGLPRGKRKGSVDDGKLKDTQWTDLEDSKQNLKTNGENNQMPPDGMVPPGSHHMDYHQPPRYPPSPNAQEVYVFSTLLANQAAQAVYTGQTDSILSFHRSQSTQREYLSAEQDTLPNSVPMPGEDSQRPPSLGPNNPNHVQPPSTGNHNNNPRGQSKDNEHNQPSPGPMQGVQLTTQRHNPAIPQQVSQENNSNEQSHCNPPPKGGNNSQTEGGNTNLTEQATKNPGSSKAQSGSNASVSNTVAQTKDTPPTTTAPTTKSKKKRKRAPSTSQPLQPNLPHPPNMLMPGMGAHGPPNFGPFSPQHYGPGPGPGGFPPQQRMQPLPMSLQPEVPPQFAQPTTETENLDPSALWETPPSSKKSAPSPNFPPGWQQEQQQIRMMQQQGPQLPMMSQSQSIMSHSSESMMSHPRPPFMDPAHGEPPPPPEQFGQFGPGQCVNDPFDMPNYKPPQQIDNPTPEQLRRREEKFRQIKEMQRLLFPEDLQNTSPTPTPNRMVSPTGSMGSMGVSSPREMMMPQQNMVPPQMQNMMRPGMMGPQRPMMHPSMAGHPRMPQSEESVMSLTPEQRMMMSQQPMMMPPPPDWENMTPPQREWYKLQQEFYQDKRQKMMSDQMKAAQMRMSEIPGPPNSFNDPMDMPMPGQGPMTAHGSIGHGLMSSHGPMPLHGPGPGSVPSPGPAGPSPGPMSVPGPGPGMSGPGMGISGPGPGMGMSGPGMGMSGPGPGMGMSGPGPGMGMSGPGSGPGMSGPGPGLGMSGPGPGPGMSGPGTGMGALGSETGMSTSGTGTGMSAPGPGSGMSGPGPGMSGPGPGMSGPGPGMSGPGPGMSGPGTGISGSRSGPRMTGPGSVSGMSGPGSATGMIGPGSGTGMGGPGPGTGMSGPGPGTGMSGPGPGQGMSGPSPGMSGPGLGPGMSGPGPGPGMSGPGSGTGMSGPGSGTGMSGSGPGTGMSGPGPGPGMRGPGMPPPPPYHSAHNQPMTGQRRSSVSGSYPAGQNQNTSFPMSPQHMTPGQQPSPRTNRSSSLPGMPPQQQMQSTPGGSSVSMPPTPMSPQQGSPMRPAYQPPTPTTTISTNMTSDTVNSNVNRTSTANVVAQSPGQPGTPVIDPNVRMNKNGSQPGTPTAPTTAKSTPPSAVTTTSTKTNSESPVTTSVGTPKPPDGTTNSQAKNSESSPGIPPQNRLVHFPSSQLNRDKAPNFPPRGEDLKQYASTFYQKTNKDSQKSQGRLQHFGSPNASSPMSQDMQMSQGMTSQPNVMTSQPSVMTSQSNVMTSQPSVMTSQPSIMTSQPSVMTSEPGMLTSESRMMTSESRIMTPESRMMTPESRIMTSESRIMTSESRMMASESRMMTPQSRMMTPQSRMMTPQSRMMTSESRMMIPQSRIMTSESRMLTPELRMMTPESRMLTSDSQSMTPDSRTMPSQSRTMSSDGGMITPENRMMTPEHRIMPDSQMQGADSRSMMPESRMLSESRLMSESRMMVASEPRMMGLQHRMMTPDNNMSSQPQISQIRMQSRMPSQARMMMLQSRMSTPQMMSSQRMMSSLRMMSPESGMHPSMMEGNPRMCSQQMMASQQSGVMHPDGRMMSPENRMMALESRMMTSQSGMMPPQSVMMSSHSGMMPSQSGMMSSQSGMMSSQRGMTMMSSPGMMTSPSGMTSPRSMMPSESRMSSQTGMSQMQSMLSSQMLSQQARMSQHLEDPNGRPHPMGHGMGGTMQNMSYEQSHGNMSNAAAMSGMHMRERLQSPQQKMSASFNPNGGMPGMNMVQMPGSGMGSMQRTSTHQGMPGSMGPGGSMGPVGMVEGHPREHMMNQGQMPLHLDSKVPHGNPSHDQSPLSLLQSRFSPPLLPDGKGPKQTIQYFPSAVSTTAPQPGQAQSGNPHVNPSLPPNSPAPPHSEPKQIQMPFPMEMITGGPGPGINPGMGLGPQRMPPSGPRMSFPHEQFQGSFPGSRGQMSSSFPPRQGMSPYGIPYGGNRMPNPGMGQPGMPGAYGDPMGYGGPPMQGTPMVMGEPMGPGYSMPK